MRYAVVIEKAGDNYSAYAPDLPGCVATGETVAKVERQMREAIRFHIEGLKQGGLPVPPPFGQMRAGRLPTISYFYGIYIRMYV